MREAVTVWLRLAIMSFGSPAVLLAAMHRTLVEEKRWISEERFLNALNYCMALPGPEGQLLATYIGWMMHRTLGGVIAGGLFLLPGTACMMALSVMYAAGSESSIDDALFFGLKPAILVIVLEALFRIGKRVLRTWLMVALAVLAFIGTFFFNLSFVIVIIGAALLGFCGALFGIATARVAPRPEPPVASDGTLATAGNPEDDLLDHTYPTVARFLRTAAFWLALWLIPVAALVVTLGSENVFSQVAVLFSKMAVLTVGGPYAVNTYVATQAVETFGWLTRRETLDGFAMAELAPGPVIQFVEFVGFLAAYRNAGALPPMVAGTLSGLLTIWVTFVPTFLWIFLVAPFIDVFRDNKIINAILSAITAAVLGVVLTFAVRFGNRTLFNDFIPIDVLGLDFTLPKIGTADPWALAIAIAAAIAMFRFKLGMFPTLAASCAVGIGFFVLRSMSGLEPPYSGLLGFVAGAAIGFPTGPIAVWCLHLRLQRRWEAVFAIVLGSAIGDLIVAAGSVFVTDTFGSAFASVQALKNPLVQGGLLILSGIALLFIVSRSVLLGLPPQGPARGPGRTYAGAGLAFFVAVSASVTHPENLLAIGSIFAVLGIGSDSGIVLLSGFFVGSFTTWFSSIELLCRLGENRGRQIMLRVMQIVCIFCIAAGCAQLARGFNLFGILKLVPMS
jgi:chromate transporter